MGKTKKVQASDVSKHLSPWRNVFMILLIYLTAWPIAYIFNKVMEGLLDRGYSNMWLAPVSAAVMLFVIVLIYMGCSKDIEDYFFYGYAFFAFLGSLDVIVGLEFTGVVNGFMSVYLRSGEPYLNSPYGAAICMCHGVGVLIMYLIMIYCISIRKSYRPVALYWSSGTSNLLLVLILGAFMGRHGLHWCTAFNIPYLIFPVVVGTYFWRHGSEKKPTHNQTLPWYMFPIHAILVIYIILAAAVQVTRTLVVLNNNIWVTKLWSNDVEPLLLLDDPGPFIKVQVLIFFFSLLPVYGLSLLALVWPGYSSFTDVNVLHAGLAVQSQICLMFTSLHPNIPVTTRPPTDYPYSTLYWTINIGLLVGPQLLMLVGFINPGWFQQKLIPNIVTGTNKKSTVSVTTEKHKVVLKEKSEKMKKQ